MGLTLNCSSFESAKNSVAAIFGTDESRLMSFLAGIQHLPSTDEFTKFIYRKACSEFGEPENHIQTVWFHGTRSTDSESFYKNGLLPKSAAREHVRSILLPLAVGIESVGRNPFALSLAGKQTEGDEGPFAVLIKDAAIYAAGSTHSYIETPEMVEDISGSLLGTNFTLLVNRFQEITKPYVVSFIENANSYELRRAVWYLYLIASGESTADAANSANTCFDGMGRIISPKKFEAIEEIMGL